MASLNIKAIKAVYREFVSYTGAVPSFTSTTYLDVQGTFDTEATAARYVVDDLIRNWDAAQYGTVPTFFKVQTLVGTNLFEVRPSAQGETPDMTSPSLGGYYFQVFKAFT